MALLAVHHWLSPAAGLRELRRVAREAVLVLTFDIDVLSRFWLFEYLPEALDDDHGRFPRVDAVLAALGGGRVEAVPIPRECTDGFFEAFYGRPEAYLDPEVRSAQSAWPRLPPGVEERALAALEADLRSGRWDRRFGTLRTLGSYDGGLRLVIAGPRS
jgi:hypothetical protein